MVNRLRLNEKSVREAESAEGRDYQIFDTDVRGFAVCIYRSGSRAFTIDYRHAGRQRRMTIGRWPEWSTTAARERAKELRREIDAGGDPLGQKETGRDAPRFKDLIDRYTEVHLPHLSALNASDQKSMLAKMVAPDWGNRLVTEITPYDVEKLLNKVAAGRARPSKAKPNTRINSQIRELLSIFHRSCYVGYTATPFANIFIDPDTDDDALRQDLFPRHFIIGLDAPSNYFGAQKGISGCPRSSYSSD